MPREVATCRVAIQIGWTHVTKMMVVMMTMAMWVAEMMVSWEIRADVDDGIHDERRKSGPHSDNL